MLVHDYLLFHHDFFKKLVHFPMNGQVHYKIKFSANIEALLLLLAFSPLFLQSTEWNALFFAAKDGNWDLTKLLIQSGANIWLKDKVCYNKYTTFILHYF